MDEYGGMFSEFEQRRVELVLAESLFDIPLADYSEYLRAKQDFEGMQLAYKIYKSQKNAREVCYAAVLLHVA